MMNHTHLLNHRTGLHKDQSLSRVRSISCAIFSAILLAQSSGKAGDITPEEGLKRLSQNIETSTQNRDELNKSIELVSRNIQTLDSATLELLGQKKKLGLQVSENKATLDLHKKKLQELDRNRASEEKKKNDEFNQIAQLEKAILELKALQVQRQERIDQLNQDRLALESSQKEGETVQLSLSGEIKEIDQKINQLKQDLVPWKKKKTAYERDAAKWNHEIERHQKMETEVKVLMDSTT